jgi:Cullin family
LSLSLKTGFSELPSVSFVWNFIAFPVFKKSTHHLKPIQVESADIITQDSEKYVEKLLALFKRFSQLVADAFRDDPRFLTSRDKAFKSVVNDTNIFRLELPGRQIGATQKTQPGNFFFHWSQFKKIILVTYEKRINKQVLGKFFGLIFVGKSGTVSICSEKNL